MRHMGERTPHEWKYHMETMPPWEHCVHCGVSRMMGNYTMMRGSLVITIRGQPQCLRDNGRPD